MDFNKLCVYEAFRKTRPYYIFIEYRLMPFKDACVFIDEYPDIATVLMCLKTSKI